MIRVPQRIYLKQPGMGAIDWGGIFEGGFKTGFDILKGRFGEPDIEAGVIIHRDPTTGNIISVSKQTPGYPVVPGITPGGGLAGTAFIVPLVIGVAGLGIVLMLISRRG